MLILNNFAKPKLKKTKFKMLTCTILISTVLCLFYIRFLYGPSPLRNVNKPNESSFTTTKIGRKLLSGDLIEYDILEAENCSAPIITELPWDGFTREQRQNGWIILHIVLLIYSCLLFITICDHYFLPSLKQIFSTVNVDQHVVGVTAMAAAGTCPELFMNFIATFIIKGDIGISTIAGSAVFNVLAVPACCGVFAVSCLQLDWWPLTRDCLIYLLSILGLMIILSDGQVWWYEALALILACLSYMLIMHYNTEISRPLKKYFKKFGYYRPRYSEVTESTTLLGGKNKKAFKQSLAGNDYQSLEQGLCSSHTIVFLEQQEEFIATPWSRGKQTTSEFFLRWPMIFLLWLTVPSHVEHYQSFKYLKFVLCLLNIAGTSYLMAFTTTIIADTFNIPDAVLGLTVLAYSTSISEAVSKIIISRQAPDCTILSNSLVGNTFDILLGLGLPWFIKALFFPELAGQKLLDLGATSSTYVGITLLTTLLAFYLILAWQNFALNRRVGLSCLVMYVSFVVIVILIEMHVFSSINLSHCSNKANSVPDGLVTAGDYLLI